MKNAIIFIGLLCLLSCDDRSQNSLAKKAIETVDESSLIKDLEKSTLESVKNEFKKKGYSYKINGVTLVHKSGNEYSGILSTTSFGNEKSIAIDVVYDGTNILWQTK